MNQLCYLFGHTGEFFDGPYHVCSRCGCHEYYHSDAVDDPAYPSVYDKNAMLWRWFVWPIKERWYHLSAWYVRHTRKPMPDDELPF